MKKNKINTTVDYINAAVDYWALKFVSIAKRSGNCLINDASRLKNSIINYKSKTIAKIQYERYGSYKARINNSYKSCKNVKAASKKKIIDLENKINNMEKKLQELEKYGVKPCHQEFKQVKKQLGNDRRMLLKMIVNENKLLKGI